MPSTKYAVLDVETTSGDPTLGRVMEVAVLVCDGAEERVRWESLLDPRMPIPPFVRRLTGIHDDDVAGAPRFIDVVNTLFTLTLERIVVAHNVRYDMTALEHEFARTGLVFERRTLCTERLSRRLAPGLQHYNLGSLCRYFGIPFTAAHRAMSDVQATAALLHHFLDEHGEQEVLRGVLPWQRAA